MGWGLAQLAVAVAEAEVAEMPAEAVTGEKPVKTVTEKPVILETLVGSGAIRRG